MPPSTPRALSTGRTEDKDKSNDVAFSTVSILPVSVSLAGVASADGSAAMRDVVLSALEAFGSAGTDGGPVRVG